MKNYFVSTICVLLVAVSYGQRDRGNRYGNQDSKIKAEINEKYAEIKVNFEKVLGFFAPSSSDEFPDFSKGLAFFKNQQINLTSIEKMISDADEVEKTKDMGQILNRDVIKDNYLPGMRAMLSNKESDEYSLSSIDEYFQKVKEWAGKAKAGGQYANENAEKVHLFYESMVQLNDFCNENKATLSYLEKAHTIYESVQSELAAKYEKYRSGAFHKSNGSGVYFVQKNGVTATSISSDDVTDHIVIDGKTPVHFFVMTDMNLGSYGGFLSLDVSDEGEGRNQNKYVFDASKILPLDEKDEKSAFKKLILVPSPDFKDMSENYVKSQFYSCYLQEKLAEELVSGEPKKLIFYAANGQIKKTVTMTATSEGIEFLKGLKTKMKKFEIDAARMEKPAVNNSELEQSIGSYFKKNVYPAASEIIRVVISSKPWYVERDVYDNITHRHCYAQVAFKGKDEHFYIQKVHCTQKYSGGSYQPLKVNSRFEPREIREENISK